MACGLADLNLMRAAICLIVSSHYLRPALAQGPNAAQVLQKVTESYLGATTWNFVGTVTTTVHGASVSRLVVSAGKEGGKLRSELRVPGSLDGSSIIIADGANVWAYSPKHNQYTKKAISDEPTGFLQYFKAPLFIYLTDADEMKTARLLREETLEVDGMVTPCFVIAVHRSRRPATTTWWIDKNRFLVLRDDQAGGLDSDVGGSRTVWITAKVNEPSPDDLFTFTPPSGARQVERIDP
jgi:outer membrane lipoprotein-sorting protein